MSLFSRIEKRGVSIAPREAFAYDGVDSLMPSGRRTAAGASVSQRTATQMIAVYACQSLISDGIAGLPLDRFMKRANGSADKVEAPGWVKQPNPWETAYSFWAKVVESLLADGNAFIATLRSDRGEVRHLYVLPPREVDVTTREGSAEPVYRIGGNVYDRSQVLHIPAFTRAGELRGLSPIDVAREAIGMGLTVEEYGARFFGQGTTMAGVIEHPGNPTADEASLLKRMFRKTHAGVKNSHAVGVLTGGAKWTNVTVSPENAQFLETRKFQKSEIALLYRVPAYLVDPTVTSTWGTGIEAQTTWFVRQTLQPWINRIESAVSTFLLPGPQYVKFNLDSRLRGSTKERYEAYGQAIQNGWMSADEARALEDLPPLPDGQGERYYRPAAWTPVDAPVKGVPGPGDESDVPVEPEPVEEGDDDDDEA